MFGRFGEKEIREPHYDGIVPVGDVIWVYLEKPAASAMVLRAYMQQDNKYEMIHPHAQFELHTYGDSLRCLGKTETTYQNEVMDQLRLRGRYTQCIGRSVEGSWINIE